MEELKNKVKLMQKLKRPLYYQVILIVVAYILSIVSMIPDLVSSFLPFYLTISMAVFVPVLFQYFVRLGNPHVLGKIFRGTAYFSTLVAFITFLYDAYWELVFYFFHAEYSVSYSLMLPLRLLIYFVIMALLFGAARVNKYFLIDIKANLNRLI